MDAMTVRLVLFDCDGTLVDSQQMICAAMNHTYAVHGLATPARDELLAIVGLSLTEAFERLAGPAEHPIASLVAQYKAAFATLRHSGQHAEALFPGAREAVERLAAQPDTVLGIVTGKSQRGVRTVLDGFDLYRHFLTIQTADDAPSKPHPGMVEQAMRAAGAAAEDTVVVGDTVFDVAMAKAAGARAIGVSWGYHRPQALHEAGAATVVADFAELLAALDALRGEHPCESTGSPQTWPASFPHVGEGWGGG